MTVVAIHQPNYLPWLGYFHKVARADVFVFLSDAQFSKNGWTNRVQALSPAGPKWLTVPVSNRFGDPIDAVVAARPGWREEHVARLAEWYRGAPAAGVLDDLRVLLGAAPDGNLAATNAWLIARIAERLALSCRFVDAREVDTGEAVRDDRLVALVRTLAPGGTYLSGRGGTGYQDPAKFRAAGLGLQMTDFAHPEWHQGREAFVPGLSIVDALLRLGWDGTRALLRP